MTRQEDTSFPMRDEFLPFEELIGKPIIILKQEERPNAKGGMFPLWLIKMDGEMMRTIPRGNLADRHTAWQMENPGVERKVVITEDIKSSGFKAYRIMHWDEEDEKLWNGMLSGDNVPF